MQSLRPIKNRIRIIENTKKVTDAMQMISVTKLRRTDKKLFALRPYFTQLRDLTDNFFAGFPGVAHPLLNQRMPVRNIGLCVITSDSGLCGLYNTNILRVADDFVKTHGANRVRLLLVGKKGFNYFRKIPVEVVKSYIGLHGRYDEEVCKDILRSLTDLFLAQSVDEVYVAYTRYLSGLTYKPVIEKLINVTPASAGERQFIIEPDKEQIAGALLPFYIQTGFCLMMLEAFTSEHSARTVAMKTANDNAKELLKSLVLLRNKLRQARITEEIMEVISSSEALKG